MRGFGKGQEFGRAVKVISGMDKSSCHCATVTLAAECALHTSIDILLAVGDMLKAKAREMIYAGTPAMTTEIQYNRR